MEYAGKIALVTGGTSGIGKATATALADAGAQVVVAARTEPTDTLLDHSRIQFIATDIADAGQVRSLVDQVAALAGRLDLAVNCAGYEGDFHPVDHYPDEECRNVIGVNLLGTFYSMKHQVRVMRARKCGSIVNLSSIAGLKGVPTASPYAASKHAVIGLTRSVALEVVNDGIRVNAVCPALVDTAMAERLTGKTGLSKADIAAASPMQRAAHPDEVVTAILWLLSAEASFVSGQAIGVDGGQSIV